MSFEVIDSLFTIKADGIMTVAMAAVILLIGFFIKSKVILYSSTCCWRIPVYVCHFYWSCDGNICIFV